MIKDVFKFKKTAWHVKLMKWIWGFDHTNFYNMCPYFWLSVFNITFIFPILLIKGIVFVSNLMIELWCSIDDSIQTICDKKAEKWYEEYKKKLETDPAFQLEVTRYINSSSYIPTGFSKKIRQNLGKLYWGLSLEKREELLDIFHNYSISQEKVREERRALEEEKRQKENLKKQNKQIKIAALTMRIKTISKYVAILIGLAAIYYSVRGIIWLITLDWSFFFNVLYFTYLVLGTVVGLILILRTIVSIIAYISCNYLKYCIPCVDRRRKLLAFFKYMAYILYPFKWLWYGVRLIGIFIYNIFKTAIEFIIAMKQNNCPAIEWED